MCMSARDLELLLKVVQTKEPWLEDPSLLPITPQPFDIGQKDPCWDHVP